MQIYLSLYFYLNDTKNNRKVHFISSHHGKKNKTIIEFVSLWGPEHTDLVLYSSPLALSPSLLFFYLKPLFKCRLLSLLTFSANMVWIMREVKTDKELYNVRWKVNLVKDQFMLTLAITNNICLMDISESTFLVSNYFEHKHFLNQMYFPCNWNSGCISTPPSHICPTCLLIPYNVNYYTADCDWYYMREYTVFRMFCKISTQFWT